MEARICKECESSTTDYYRIKPTKSSPVLCRDCQEANVRRSEANLNRPDLEREREYVKSRVGMARLIVGRRT